jgi:RNA polymerase sigma factor (sigma-70 family)
LAHDDHPHPFDSQTRELVRRKAGQLARRAGFTAQDRDDLEQDLSVLLLKRWPSFDPNRGTPEAFATIVLNSGVANLLRDRLALWRRQGRIVSLQERATGPNGEEACLADSVPQGAPGSGHRPYRRLSDELARLAGHVREVLDRLPPDLRELAELLKEHSMADAARVIGLPRSTLYARRRKLREHFEAAGLTNFC